MLVQSSAKHTDVDDFLPEVIHPGYRHVRQGQLGCESFYADSLADRVVIHAINQKSTPHDFLALDIGGASGFRAADLVKKAGFDVLIIDCEPEPDWIKTRNELLVRQTGTERRVSLHKARIQDIDASKLEKTISENYGERRPSIITAYNVVHFLKADEIGGLFKTISEVALPGSLLALSYRQAPGRWTTHDPKEITKAAAASGFERETQNPQHDNAGIEQTFRVNKPRKSYALNF